MKLNLILIGIFLVLGQGLTNVAYNCQCEEEVSNGNYCYKWKCDPETASCFSINSIVTLANGQKKTIDNLKEGDMLMTIDPKTLKKTGTDFIDYIHLLKESKTNFLRFTLESGETLEATNDHILYTKEQGYKIASKIQVGHTMITENGIKKVTNIENVEESGIYAPATSDIGLFVNGIYVTGISKFEHVDWQVSLVMSMYKQLKKLPVIGDYISQRNSQGLIVYWSIFDYLTYGFGGIGEKMAKYFIGY